MPLDRSIAALLPMFDAAPKLNEGTPEQGRAGLHTLLVDFREADTLRQVEDISDAEVAGVPVRVYRPAGQGPRPTVVYLHGGGWVIGSVATHDGVCRQLADDVAAVVVSVEYRLAPEHPFPAGLEDCWAVLQAVAADIDTYGGDAAKLAVGGDSAGGNLAAVCAQLARADGPALAAQLLVYPVTDPLTTFPSTSENGSGYFLTTDDMAWFGRQYIGMDETDPRVAELVDDARLSPAKAASLEGLPPAIVVTAEYDPLRDDGNAYAAALRDAGVEVRHRQFDGLIHGFYGMEHLSPGAAAASEWIDGQLRDVLA